MFLEVPAPYEPRKLAEYKPLPEDRGKAVIIYNRICEWLYPFAIRVKELLREIDSGLPVCLIDEWKRPDESMRLGNQWLVVNAVPIRSFWMQREAFRSEIMQALGT